jgi:hypothetical protein
MDPSSNDWEVARVMKSVLDRPCKVITKSQDTQSWLTTDGCANAGAIFADCKHQADCQQQELDNYTQSPEYRPHI